MPRGRGLRCVGEILDVLRHALLTKLGDHLHRCHTEAAIEDMHPLLMILLKEHLPDRQGLEVQTLPHQIILARMFLRQYSRPEAHQIDIALRDLDIEIAVLQRLVDLEAHCLKPLHGLIVLLHCLIPEAQVLPLLTGGGEVTLQAGSEGLHRKDGSRVIDIPAVPVHLVFTVEALVEVTPEG